MSEKQELKYQIQIREQLIYFSNNDDEISFWRSQIDRFKEKLKSLK